MSELKDVLKEYLKEHQEDFKFPCHKQNGKECKNYDCWFNHEGLCALGDIELTFDDFPIEVLEAVRE